MMIYGLKKSHLRKAHQVRLPEVRLPDYYLTIHDSIKSSFIRFISFSMVRKWRLDGAGTIFRKRSKMPLFFFNTPSVKDVLNFFLLLFTSIL